MTNIPKTIYLQIGEDCPMDDGENFNDLSEVSWCRDKIFENDIEYVLKDELITRIKELILEACYAGFNQAHYSHMHPEICPPKECESAGKEYLAKKEKSIEDLSQLK
jgi:hypothetical protein